MTKNFTLTRNNIHGESRYNGFLAMCPQFVQETFGINTKRKRVQVTLSDKPIKGGGGKRMYWYGRYVALKYEDALSPCENGHFLYDTARETLREAFPLTPAFAQVAPTKFYLKIV